MIDGVYTILDRIDELRKRFGMTKNQNNQSSEQVEEKQKFTIQTETKTEVDAVKTEAQAVLRAQQPVLTEKSAVTQTDLSSIFSTITADHRDGGAFSTLTEMNQKLLQSAVDTYKKQQEEKDSDRESTIDTVK